VTKKIRVVIVDDSLFLRRNLPRILEADPDIEVVGVAANGEEGVQLVKTLRPDVVTLDVMMPVMDGLTALGHIMRDMPTPVVMVSSTTREGAQVTLEALALGAQGVLLGRPALWGLAAYGAEGVQTIVELIQTGFARDMAMCGRVNIKAIDGTVVKIHRR